MDVDDIISKESVFISNEGNFMYGNASLSLYNKATHEVINDVFYKQNGVPLGDVAQSMKVHNGLLYVVVNNSGKIYVLNMGKYPHLPAFDYVGKITGLTSPRYIHFINDTKAYITDLYSKTITIINPETLEKTGKISVDNHSPEFYQHPTEQMVQYNKYIFTNCWSYDNKILVIDSEKDQVVDSITVGLQPTSLVLDKNNYLWTITDGGYDGSPYGYEAPSLWKIDAATHKVEQSFQFNLGDRGSEVKLNGTRDTLYFINGGIWKMAVNDKQLPDHPFISGEDKLFYGLNIDPVNSDIYAIDAIDYSQPGVVYRLSPKGKKIDSFKVGIIPGEACFY
ncbi:YncE family protein [Puteibacter caeruleilacunae]|nr:YncE family protein [Puteibacter caeruleilacunae]